MSLLRAAVVVVVSALVAGCGGGGGDGGDAPAAASAVTVKTFMFQPDPIEVDAGSTVTWTNEDTAVHTVTSGPRSKPDGRFDERLAESGGAARQTFEEPGTYRYFCSLHSGPGMEGEVIVR